MKFYGKVVYNKRWNRWYITAEPYVCIRLKDFFKAIKKEDKGQLSLSNTVSNCKDLDWFLVRYPMEMTNQDRLKLISSSEEFDKNVQVLDKMFLPNYLSPIDLKINGELREYQKQAVEVLLTKKSLLCGDDVGLGKTLVAIGAMAATKELLPAAIVCQTNLPIQWMENINRFIPNLRVHIVRSRSPYTLPEADVYIISYSKLQGWEDFFASKFFKFACFDECQELRIVGTQKYDAAKKLAENASHVLGLSATPVYNYGSEIWSIANLIRPNCLSSFEEFTREWCLPTWQTNDTRAKVENPSALGAYLRDQHFLLRRSREDVGQELPEVNKIVQIIDADEKMLYAKEKEMKELSMQVLEGSFMERGSASRQLNSLARMLTGVAKANAVADYVIQMVENGEKVLLTGWHREVYLMWEKKFNLAGIPFVMYTGSESPKQKNDAKKAFVDGKASIMVISLRSGIGLDGLQHDSVSDVGEMVEGCKFVVFGELDWSPQVHHQLIGRLQRDGQKKHITAVYLNSEGGTDPLMIETLGVKASQSSGILNPKFESDTIDQAKDDQHIKKLAASLLKKELPKNSSQEKQKNKEKEDAEFEKLEKLIATEKVVEKIEGKKTVDNFVKNIQIKIENSRPVLNLTKNK